MKITPRAYQIFWDVHAWGGIVTSLVLTLMFFAGAFTLFHHEFAQWQDPKAGPAPELSLSAELAKLSARYPLEGVGRIAFEIEHDAPASASWHDKDGKETALRYHPEDGEWRPVRSSLSEFLYRLHYLDVLPMGVGVYLAGLLSLAMLLITVTGLLVHWKDMGRLLFEFRPKLRQRIWSTDLHKLFGFFGLPFQVLFAWSGAVLCLGYITVVPLFVSTLFAGDEEAGFAVYGRISKSPEAVEKKAPLADVDLALEKAKAAVPGLHPSWVGVQNVGDEASSVWVYGDVPELPMSFGEVLVSRYGKVLETKDPRHKLAPAQFERWLYGLHFVHFGGLATKLLFFLLALCGCGVFITGNVVWIERRKRPGHSQEKLLRFTAFGSAGLALATASLFVAARVLPTVEKPVFAAVWLLAAGIPFTMRRLPVVKTSAAMTALAAVGFLLLPALDGLGLAPQLFQAASGLIAEGVLVMSGLLLGALAAVLFRLSAPKAQTAVSETA